MRLQGHIQILRGPCKYKVGREVGKCYEDLMVQKSSQVRRVTTTTQQSSVYMSVTEARQEKSNGTDGCFLHKRQVVPSLFNNHSESKEREWTNSGTEIVQWVGLWVHNTE
jgi:hypothetical protein